MTKEEAQRTNQDYSLDTVISCQAPLEHGSECKEPELPEIDWMTICIVARSAENDSFVAAGDRLFSYGKHYSYESVSLKRVGLTWDGRWHTMFAASPVANVLPVVRQARRDLKHYRPPHRRELVERACVTAYQAQREQLVNDTILSKYGLDLATYRREGINLGVQECARLNVAIENLVVGLQLIVFGYDDLNQAHIFIVSDPGKSMCCDQDGIAVIGSGGGHARASLLSNELPVISQAEMLCRVCEAKFEAEQNRYVGRDSAAGVIKRPTNRVSAISEAFISIPAMEAIRAAHAAQKHRPYPQKLIELISDEIDSDITSERMHEVIMRAVNQIKRENAQRRKRNKQKKKRS